jgi:hypothetical protein
MNRNRLRPFENVCILQIGRMKNTNILLYETDDLFVELLDIYLPKN